MFWGNALSRVCRCDPFRVNRPVKTALMELLNRLRRIPRAWWLVFLLITVAAVWLIYAWSARDPAGTDLESQAEQVIENKGSDTLVNLALAWAEAYMGEHPSVRISVTGGGRARGSRQ